MKRTREKVERTEEDKQCGSCANTFRSCPMDLVLALDRVPEGIHVAVLFCPEYRKKEEGVTGQEGAKI